MYLFLSIGSQEEEAAQRCKKKMSQKLLCWLMNDKRRKMRYPFWSMVVHGFFRLHPQAFCFSTVTWACYFAETLHDYLLVVHDAKDCHIKNIYYKARYYISDEHDGSIAEIRKKWQPSQAQKPGRIKFSES